MQSFVLIASSLEQVKTCLRALKIVMQSFVLIASSLEQVKTCLKALKIVMQSFVMIAISFEHFQKLFENNDTIIPRPTQASPGKSNLI